MRSYDMNTIVKYAIQREYSAAKFYRHLKTKVNLNSSKIFLDDLIAMELAHAEYLENLDLNTLPKEFVDVENSEYGIAENLEEKAPEPNMTFAELLILAIKTEVSSAELYSTLSDSALDNNAKILFNNLKNEEIKHKLYLEDIYEKEILKEN